MEAANKIAIITDTCCDLPQEYLKEYPIFCVPLVVTSGTESYRDNIDITVETIYARQKNENFKTSLPRPQDIEDVYSAIARQGYTHVIVLMIAECLSSANNLMRLAAEEHPELTVKVFDSKSASIGLGALAVQVARYAVRGVAFDPLCELTKRLIDDTVVYFSLDTLEYLQRGGRIGRATAPLVVTSGTESYRDNIDITVETIYARQKNENFKTSLPRPQDIEDVYSAIARQGYTHVIVLMIAECLSSANNLMRLAAEEHPELTVKVFDSKSASIGLGALAVQVARYAVRGVAFDPLCELTKRLIDDTVVYFSLDTLEYLQRGGRIGRATALAGGLLQIKPILTFDRKDGMISTAAKVRGRRGVQQRLIELATELAAKHPGEEYNLVVCDGNVPEEGAALEAALIRALPNAHRVLHGKIDATLAVHLGPNLLGVGVQFLNSKLPA